MFLVYLGEVLKRTFTPTSRLTDGLQIAAASALPALANFAGYDLPPSAEGSVLAYIGLAAIALLGIRLVWAPYSLWKEQMGEAAGLRLELSKPERMVWEHLARLRAQRRLQVTRLVDEMYTCGFEGDGSKARFYKASNNCKRVAQEAGLPSDFTYAIVALRMLSQKRMEKKMEEGNMDDLNHVDMIYDYLNNRITIEVLKHQSTSYIAQEKPQ